MSTAARCACFACVGTGLNRGRCGPPAPRRTHAPALDTDQQAGRSDQWSAQRRAGLNDPYLPALRFLFHLSYLGRSPRLLRAQQCLEVRRKEPSVRTTIRSAIFACEPESAAVLGAEEIDFGADVSGDVIEA